MFLKFCMKNLYNNSVPLTTQELADVPSSAEDCTVFEGIMSHYLLRFLDMPEKE